MTTHKQIYSGIGSRIWYDDKSEAWYYQFGVKSIMLDWRDDEQLIIFHDDALLDIHGNAISELRKVLRLWPCNLRCCRVLMQTTITELNTLLGFAQGAYYKIAALPFFGRITSQGFHCCAELCNAHYYSPVELPNIPLVFR